MCKGTTSCHAKKDLFYLLGCRYDQHEITELKSIPVDWVGVGHLLSSKRGENDDNEHSSSTALGQAPRFPYSPLKIAVYNQITPVPGEIIRIMLEKWPTETQVDIETTFKMACSNLEIELSTIEVLLDFRPDLLTHWSLRHLASNKNVRVAHYIVRNHPTFLPCTWLDWGLVFGLAHQAFWLEMMIQCDSPLVSRDSVQEMNLLHFFVSQSNLDAVKLIVQIYPDTLSVRMNGKLPLHIALSSYEGRGYGWSKSLVQYLLEEGLRLGVGIFKNSTIHNPDYISCNEHPSSDGYGGLFSKDYDGITPLDTAISMVRQTAFSPTLAYGERWNCLMACITFANDLRRGHDHDSIFHAALRIIPFEIDILESIIENYNVDVGDVDVNGMNSLHIVIDAMSQLIHTCTMHDYQNVNELFCKLLTPGKFSGSSPSLAKETYLGRTPLSMAAANQIPYYGGLNHVVNAHPVYLEEIDSASSVYPFMLTKNCVTSTYELLRLNIQPLLDLR